MKIMTINEIPADEEDCEKYDYEYEESEFVLVDEKGGVAAVKKKKAWKPRRERGNQPTLTGQPQLGYLNSFYCPICWKHLFSCYDADIDQDRKDSFRFRVASDWHYCSKCGTMLDLAEWQQGKTPASAAAVGADEELKFDG